MSNISKAGIVNAAYLFEDVDISKTDALNIIGANYHICVEGEYDPQTYIPTLQGQTGIIYITPIPEARVGMAIVGLTVISGSGSRTGYIYNGTSFERIQLSEYFKNDKQLDKLLTIGDYPRLTGNIKAQIAKDHIIVREFIEW